MNNTITEPLLKIGTEKPSVEVRLAWGRHERETYGG